MVFCVGFPLQPTLKGNDMEFHGSSVFETEATLPVTDKRAISGHSMGGHGALTIGLKNPDRPLSRTSPT